jgi:hypothetical protein
MHYAVGSMANAMEFGIQWVRWQIMRKRKALSEQDRNDWGGIVFLADRPGQARVEHGQGRRRELADIVG